MVFSFVFPLLYEVFREFFGSCGFPNAKHLALGTLEFKTVVVVVFHLSHGYCSGI